MRADPGPCSPDAPRPYERALCALILVSPITSRGAPRPAMWETSISEGKKYGREMVDPILPTASDFHDKCRDLLYATKLRHLTDSFTSPLKEGMLRIFFFLLIRRLQPGLNPRTWVPEASMLTNRPLKPLPSKVSNSVKLHSCTIACLYELELWAQLHRSGDRGTKFLNILVRRLVKQICEEVLPFQPSGISVRSLQQNVSIRSDCRYIHLSPKNTATLLTTFFLYKATSHTQMYL
jgi:hypothetical protein